MPSLSIHPDVPAAIAGFRLPQRLGFGQTFAPIMYQAEFRDGAWEQGQLLPYGRIVLDPASKVLHYAQSVFEGLKAFRATHDRAVIFRPALNWERMNRAASRMLMPELPRGLFMEALYALTAHCEASMPRSSGQSLYLRPIMFGTQPALGLAASDAFSFLVIASPSQAVASGPLRVIVERKRARAATGGTGDIKASGNYGASLRATADAAASGFSQPLWLDSVQHRYVEELSIMNFFAVVDGMLLTPALNDSILDGVTRRCVIELALGAEIPVRECRIEIDELLALIDAGRCTEAFACGTAAIVAPVSAIGDGDGRIFELAQPLGLMSQKLRQDLLDIQEGRAEDRFGWLHSIPDEYYPAPS
jgi:branched-chain amino acid aminotransferase